jgi:drug/metabolite transporter (DMT)-like permease
VETRKALDGQATAMMLVLCMIWSLQQIGLKAAAPYIAPMTQIGLRSGIAAVLVGILMLVRKEKMSLGGGAWRPGLAIGLLFAFEYLLLGQGLRHTSAAHAVVFLYTAPIFAAVGLHLKLPAERLAPRQWFGIALAFIGVAVTFFGRDAGATGGAGGGTGGVAEDALLGDLLSIGAGAAWGATTVVVRCSGLSKIPATQTLLYQLVAAFVLLLAGAAATGQLAFSPGPVVWGSLLFQSVIVSFASFLAWFGLLRRYLASRLGVFSFMTPIFGIVLGAWLLGERIEPGFLAGSALVLAGIVIVSAHGWMEQKLGAIAGKRKAA